MDKIEVELLSKSHSEEEENKEFGQPISLSVLSDPVDDPVQLDINLVYLEALDKEFQKLASEETKKNDNEVVEDIEREVNENHQGETAEEIVKDDEETVEENQIRDVWTVEVNQDRDGCSVEEIHSRGGWTGEEKGKVDGLTNGDGWTVEEKGNIEGDNVEGKEKNRKSNYPSRPGEPDCTYYLKTGNCGFGSNCKFNHPPKKKQHKVRSPSSDSQESAEAPVAEEKAEIHKRVGQLECKYYLTPGGCKFGKACRYHHPREKHVVAPPVEFNFLSLPIRPGERECPFYMRTGSCKFATNCRFNHPDPTAAGSDLGYDRSSSVPLHSLSDSQSAVASWSTQRPTTDAVPYSDSSRSYIPAMLQPQGLQSSLEWNGYQAPANPLYAPERIVHPPMASALSGTNKNADAYSHHLQQMPVDTYPERPGQKECQYYMKTGDCKYKSACRFHHPRSQVVKSPSLTPSGLPLRPDQATCSHFSRYGICKYRAACKYDHTPSPNSSIAPVVSVPGAVPYYHNSATFVAPNMVNGGDGSRAFVQQPV